jgi:DNA repair photolyase
MTLRVIYEPKGRAGEYAELAVNLYRGCGHGCSFQYCYAPSVLKMTRKEFQQPVARKGILDKLERDAAELEYAADDRAVMLCFTCDAYQVLDEKLQITRRALEILKRHGRTVEILTKGGTRALRDFNLLDPRDAFACTLTFDNATDSRAWEPHAAEPDDRIKALRIAHQRGLRTWASMEPVIKPDQSLAMIERSLEWVQLYKLGAWNYDQRAKEIDWAAYHAAATAMIRGAGKGLLVKDDLLKRAGVAP